MKNIIEAIEARMQDQKNTIQLQQYEIADLKAKLEAAERER